MCRNKTIRLKGKKKTELKILEMKNTVNEILYIYLKKKQSMDMF